MQDLSGRRLGNYELRERIGRGGMAEVYKAYQAGMDRFVAIKVMLGHLADDDNFIERFKREAQAVGKLRHSHIVNIFDFGIEDDMYYMAMEFIQGGTLKEYIVAQEKLSVAETLRIMHQLSDGLDYAHKAGMIHRDLKPANAMFIDKTYKQAVLTDFGIARILGAAGLTGTGMSVGTPSYMSPEAGRGEPTDERADIYAMGVMLYEMLTGQAPYDADTPLAVIMQHINAPLPTFHDDEGDVPEAVERIILKCMAKEPDDRYQTAGELTQAVGQAMIELDHQAVTKVASPALDRGTVISPSLADFEEAPTTPTMPDDRTQRLPRIRQGGFNPLIGIAAIVVVVILAIAAFMALNNGADDTEATPVETEIVAVATEMPVTEVPATEIPIETEEPLPTEEIQQESVEDIFTMPPRPENLNIFTGISPLMDEVDGMIIRGEGEVAIEMLNALLEENPENVDALFARSQLYSLDYDEENIAGQDAEAIIALEPDNPLGFVALSDSWLNYPDQDPEQAREVIQRAYELAPDNPHVLWRYGNLGEWDVELEQTLAAEEMGASGFRFIYRMGGFLMGMREYSRALPYLEIGAMQGSPTLWNTQDSFWSLLGALMSLDQTETALDLFLQRGIIETTTEGEVFMDGAYIAYRAGNYELAREWADTARALWDEAHGATYVLGLIAWWGDNNLELAMEHLNSLEETDVWTRYLNWELGHDLSLDRARILTDAGQFEGALEFYNRVIEQDDYTDWLYEERANVLLELGNIDAAREDLQRAFEITEDDDYRIHLRDRIVELGPAPSDD